MLNNLVVIGGAGLYALAPGLIGETGLAIATTGGVAAMALAQAWGLRRLGLSMAGRIRPNHPAIRRAARLGAPLLVLTAVLQAGVAVRANLASSIEGGFAALQHVHRFFQLPYGLLAVTIFTLTMPGLARAAARGDRETERREATRAFRWSAAAILPATLLYAALAPWLMGLLMSWGRLRAEDAELLGGLLRLQALATFPMVVMMLSLRVFFARQETLAPALIQGGAALAQMGLCVLLFPVAGLEGIAISMLPAYGAGAVAGLIWARRRLFAPERDLAPEGAVLVSSLEAQSGKSLVSA